MPLARLLAGEDYALGDWYATPLTSAQAGMLLEAARQAQRSCLCAGGSCGPMQMLAEICHFWLGKAPRAGATDPVTHPREAALRELVTGQLLASRKRVPATTHLARGFRLAAPFLETPEYFRLVREHELLACLPYSDRPAVAQDLPVLLNEAAVIRRLRHGDRRRPIWPHLDTVG